MAKEAVKDSPKIEIREPKMYKVIIYNDDFTPMDLVVEILEQVFNKTKEEAVRLMLGVHNSTSAVVGVYTKDIAKTKAAAATDMARKEGYPLKIEAVEE